MDNGCIIDPRPDLQGYARVDTSLQGEKFHSMDDPMPPQNPGGRAKTPNDV
jgi:hypothetical protein